MTKIVNIGNGKGGVNKTTICLQLAFYCAEEGKKTLLIDLDGQEDLTRFLGKPQGYTGLTSANLFREVIDLESFSAIPVTNWVCRNKELPKFAQFVPGDFAALANINSNATPAMLDLFKSNVQRIAEHFNYDVVIIDTPPSLGACQYASLRVATSSVLPCIPDFDTCGPEKIQQYFKVYNTARTNGNPKLGLPVVVISSVDIKADKVKEYLTWSAETFKANAVPRYLERSAAILNSNSARRAVWFGTKSGNDAAKGATYRRVIASIFERLV